MREPTSVARHLEEVLAIDPAAPAVEAAADEWWSWGDLQLVTRSLRDAFAVAQLSEGARVGVLMRNRPQQLAGLLACVLDGKCMVALNPLMPANKLVPDVVQSAPAMLVASAEDIGAFGLTAVAREIGCALIALPPGRGAVQPVSGLARPTTVDLPTRPGILVEMLTSGTTGTPKRVPLSARSFEVSFTAATAAYEKRDASEDPAKLRTGVRILPSPLTHISGISAALMTLAAGRKIALLDKFRVDDFVAALARHRPKVANAPPAALRMMLDANVPKEMLSSLVTIRTGTAPLDPAVQDEFLARYDVPVLPTYGATEFAGAVAGWSLVQFRKYYPAKRGSVGRLMSGFEARVVDADSGAARAPGEEGILELRGAQLGHDDWMRTTDRVVLDADGFLFIKGRADGAIIRGGFKVHADDVVKAVELHPGVREAAVVGIPDARLGQVPVCALIVASGASPLDAAELSVFLREKLLPYQIPTQFRFVEDLPRTPSLKPSLPDVRALFTAESWEQEP